MNRTFVYILFCIVVTGCVNKPARNSRLVSIDSVLQLKPDSTIMEFYFADVAEEGNNVNKQKMMSRTLDLNTIENTAYFNLLYSEYILNRQSFFSCDTMINKSINYYCIKTKGNESLLARSYLVRARNRMARGELTGAIRDLMMAGQWNIEDINENYSFQFDYVRGTVNLKAGCFSLSEKLFRKALEKATLMNDTSQMVLCYDNLAMSYDYGGCRDSFFHYVRKMQPLLPSVNEQVRAEVFVDLGDFYWRLHDENKAYKYLSRGNLRDLTGKSSLLLADYYMKYGDRSKAVDLWFEAANSNEYGICATALDSLHVYLPNDEYVTDKLLAVYKKVSRNNGLLLPNESLLSDNKPTSIVDVSEEVADIQQKYEQSRAENHNYRVVITLLSLITLLILLFLLLFFFHFYKVRKYRKHISILNGKYMDDIEAYNTARENLDKANADISVLQKRIIAYQDDYERTEKMSIEEMLLNNDSILHLHRMASRGEKATNDDWQELCMLITDHDKVFSLFISKHIELKFYELCVCQLVRLRFLPSEMVILLDVSPQSMTNIRVRLMKKLFEIKGGAKEFDLKIRSI